MPDAIFRSNVSAGWFRHALAACAAGLLLFAPATQSAHAQSAAEFYNGRTVSLIVGYGPGGGYDVYARHFARHFGKYLPGNPVIVVQNMPGAGSLVAANHIYNAAARDGSVFGTFARDMALSALLKANPNIRFDPRKFTWIGTPASSEEDVYLTFVRKESQVREASDILRPGGPEVVLGGTGAGSAGNDWALLLRDALGMRIKLIPGYRDSSGLFLAVERGEIDGRSLDYSAVRSSRPLWLQQDSPVRVLLQFGRTTRHRDFPNVPLARDFAKTPEQIALLDLAELSNTLARPFAAPPDLPADRTAALRKAFIDMAKDKDYIAEGEKLRIDISPIGGEEILKVIERMASVPTEVLERMKAIRAASQGAR
ncbi:MAG: hypothetical protein FJX29_04095 [Alphaproteobacteria bacterium]|nr:hypothetical protein [Alphaproteobacteria bacterium]